MKDTEILDMIANRNFSNILNRIDFNDAISLRKTIDAIPDGFYVPKFSEGDGKENLSLIQIVMQMSSRGEESVSGYMERYKIDPADYYKLQEIVNSIQQATESITQTRSRADEEKAYGISLSNRNSLDKAYLLRLAAYFSGSKDYNRESVGRKLREDGQLGSAFSIDYVMNFISQAESRLIGKTEEEKQNSYLAAITKVLGDGFTMPTHDEKDKEEIEE